MFHRRSTFDTCCFLMCISLRRCSSVVLCMSRGQRVANLNQVCPIPLCLLYYQCSIPDVSLPWRRFACFLFWKQIQLSRWLYGKIDVRRCVCLEALALVGIMRALVIDKKTYTASENHIPRSANMQLRVTPFPNFLHPFGCPLCTVPLANRQRMSLLSCGRVFVIED